MTTTIYGTKNKNTLKGNDMNYDEQIDNPVMLFSNSERFLTNLDRATPWKDGVLKWSKNDTIIETTISLNNENKVDDYISFKPAYLTDEYTKYLSEWDTTLNIQVDTISGEVDPVYIHTRPYKSLYKTPKWFLNFIEGKETIVTKERWLHNEEFEEDKFIENCLIDDYLSDNPKVYKDIFKELKVMYKEMEEFLSNPISVVKNEGRSYYLGYSNQPDYWDYTLREYHNRKEFLLNKLKELKKEKYNEYAEQYSIQVLADCE